MVNYGDVIYCYVEFLTGFLEDASPTELQCTNPFNPTHTINYWVVFVFTIDNFKTEKF